MQIGLRIGHYRDVVCDLLGFPVFEDEGLGSPALKALDKQIGGALHSALDSGEFKAELHRTHLLHNPKSLKARRLLLIGAGKRVEFSPARLREMAGTSVRRARTINCKAVGFVARGEFEASESAC